MAYDSAGRMASRVVKTGATPAAAKSESYFFDAVDRLTRVVVHAGHGALRHRWRRAREHHPLLVRR